MSPCNVTASSNESCEATATNRSNSTPPQPNWNLLIPSEYWLAQVRILMAIYIAIGVVGSVGNLLCLVVLLCHAPLRKKQANYFIISQSVIDLLVSLLLPLNTNIVLAPKGALGVVTCYLWSSRTVFLGLFLASLFNITALTVERYVKTVHPVRHHNWATKPRMVCMIVVVAVAGVLAKMPYALGGTAMFRGYCLVQYYPNAAIYNVVAIYNFLVEYFVPLAVIAFCYLRMARSLRRADSSVVLPVETRTAKARRNILKTLAIVVLLFVICTTFKQVVLLAKVFNETYIDYYGLPFNASQALSFLVCCTNPFVYIVHCEDFKRGLRLIVCRKCNLIHPNRAENTFKAADGIILYHMHI